ncbi:hypothetical protein IV102_30870, partial [bacterium]|nr:hypothetical protein [bacterium]
VFEGILVAGDSATLGQKPWQIAGQEPATGLVSLDFVNADLIYVLYILAKELKLNAIIAPEVVGSFTITAKSLPTIRMIGLALWIQNQNYEARLDQNFLLVNTVMPEPGAAPTSNQPLLTVEPEMSLLSQPTKVREVPTRCGR